MCLFRLHNFILKLELDITKSISIVQTVFRELTYLGLCPFIFLFHCTLPHVTQHWVISVVLWVRAHNTDDEVKVLVTSENVNFAYISSSSFPSLEPSFSVCCVISSLVNFWYCTSPPSLLSLSRTSDQLRMHHENLLCLCFQAQSVVLHCY